jgi:ParB family chromosome partitioning protein
MALDLSSLSEVGALLRAQNEGKGLRRVRVDAIHPDPNQPRKTFDEESLAELADSIQAIGIIQPPVVRSRDDGYLLIAGERRWRAACQLGLEMIDVIVRDDLAGRAQLIENIQREALSHWEIYRVIAGELGAGMTQVELARALGKSGGWIGAYAAVGKMPEIFLSLLRESRITDITALGHLYKLHQQNPQAAEMLLGSPEPITRAMITDARTQVLPHRLPKENKTSSSSQELPIIRESNVVSQSHGKSVAPTNIDADASQTDAPPAQPKVSLGLPVRIRAYFDNASWIVDYTQQRKDANRGVFVRLKGDRGIVTYAPIEALRLQSIECR